MNKIVTATPPYKANARTAGILTKLPKKKTAASEREATSIEDPT